MTVPACHRKTSHPCHGWDIPSPIHYAQLSHPTKSVTDGTSQPRLGWYFFVIVPIVSWMGRPNCDIIVKHSIYVMVGDVPSVAPYCHGWVGLTKGHFVTDGMFQPLLDVPVLSRLRSPNRDTRLSRMVCSNRDGKDNITYMDHPTLRRKNRGSSINQGAGRVDLPGTVIIYHI